MNSKVIIDEEKEIVKRKVRTRELHLSKMEYDTLLGIWKEGAAYLDGSPIDKDDKDDVCIPSITINAQKRMGGGVFDPCVYWIKVIE